MMMEAKMTTAKRGRNLMAALAVVTGVLVLSARPLPAAAQATPAARATPAAQATPAARAKPAGKATPAAHAKKAAKERTVSVNINKGELYIIDGVGKHAAPGIKVVDNPNALLVHTEKPGSIVLLGAAAGHWKLHVTLADGEKVIYEVNVNAVGPPQGSLVPYSAPTAMR